MTPARDAVAVPSGAESEPAKGSTVQIADVLPWAGAAFIVVAVLLMLGGITIVERLQHADDDEAAAHE